jgi:hypothetical protein
LRHGACFTEFERGGIGRRTQGSVINRNEGNRGFADRANQPQRIVQGLLKSALETTINDLCGKAKQAVEKVGQADPPRTKVREG